jgi:hypothetical protein
VAVGEGLCENSLSQRRSSKIEVESTPGKPVKENEEMEGNCFTPANRFLHLKASDFREKTLDNPLDVFHV